MKKEYIVVRIEGSPDGAPFVVVSLSSSKDFKEQNSTPMSPFGSGVMGFSNMDDMIKGLNKVMAGGGMGGMGGGGMTSIKLDMHEYKELNLSVGDKVYLEITRAESLGI